MQSPSGDTQKLLNQLTFTYVYNQVGFFHAHFLLQKCYLSSTQDKCFFVDWSWNETIQILCISAGQADDFPPNTYEIFAINCVRMF